MYCTNTMKIEMNNNIKAIKAMDIIKSLIMENKDAYNKNYRKDASQMLLDALAIDNNCIIISDELFGEFFPEDSKMFTDIVNALANQLKSEFEAKICNTSDEYSCAMKSHFRKSGNQMSGKWKSSHASLLA